MPRADGEAPPSTRRRLAHFAVLASAALAYSNALGGPFQFDDPGVITRDPSIQSWAAYAERAAHGLRPLLKLSYAFNYWLGGERPFGYHLFNVALHVLVVELVMRLATAMSHREARLGFAPRDAGAFVAGLGFALHPMHTEAVTYISGRSSSLSTLFALASCLLYAEAARAPRRSLPLTLSLVSFVLGILVKEAVAALVGALVLWELVIERARPRAALGRLAPFLLVLLAALAVAVAHPGYFRLLYTLTGTRSLAASALHQLAGVGYLTARIFAVHRLCIDPGLGIHEPDTPALATGVLVVTGACLLAQRQRLHRPALALGVVWFCYHTLAPYVLLPRFDVINERHAYLASAGLWAGLGPSACALYQSATHRLRTALGALALLLAVLALAFTLRRNVDYASEVALWQSTVRVAPRNPRAQHNLGVALERADRMAEANAAYARALMLEPRFERAQRALERLARQRRTRPRPHD